MTFILHLFMTFTRLAVVKMRLSCFEFLFESHLCVSLSAGGGERSVWNLPLFLNEVIFFSALRRVQNTRRRWDVLRPHGFAAAHSGSPAGRVLSPDHVWLFGGAGGARLQLALTRPASPRRPVVIMMWSADGEQMMISGLRPPARRSTPSSGCGQTGRFLARKDGHTHFHTCESRIYNTLKEDSSTFIQLRPRTRDSESPQNLLFIAVSLLLEMESKFLRKICCLR